jgi:A/G-specific adenine glycosylase
MEGLVDTVIDWYREAARELPWRDPSASPYAVLVSELMLQQTPVARVLPVYAAWLERWPTVGSLAAASAGDAVRQWGRLGYPRRALRLHAAAVACVEKHKGEIPCEYDDLLALPGVGSYTAAAVASFAYGQAHPVLDTNVRRVLARVLDGVAAPAPTPRRAETERARELLPPDGRAPLWSVAVMELGALVCTARKPSCATCPIAASCAWRQAGWPAPLEPARPAQRFTGTDRQVRGLLMASLREATEALPAAALDSVWPDAEQRGRALKGLLDDGLVVPVAEGFALPG